MTCTSIITKKLSNNYYCYASLFELGGFGLYFHWLPMVCPAPKTCKGALSLWRKQLAILPTVAVTVVSLSVSDRFACIWVDTCCLSIHIRPRVNAIIFGFSIRVVILQNWTNSIIFRCKYYNLAKICRLHYNFEQRLIKDLLKFL